MPIKLQFQSSYKSIGSLDEQELPDFTVITGLNGSGKSQLLESILQKNAGIRAFSADRVLKRIKHVNHTTLSPNNSGSINHSQITQATENALQNFNNYKNKKSQNGLITIHQVIKDPVQIEIINQIARNADKNLEDLDESDFYTHYPIDDGLAINDVFRHNFSLIFKRYHTKFEDNLVSEYRFDKYGEGSHLSRKEFILKYGPPPWDLVNRVLEESRVNYQVNNPEGSHRDSAFTLRLINTISGAEVNFTDLSSGEKVLVSLALSLYNLNSKVEFPELLLMDEPDAPLHPSMTKDFIDVLRRVFVEERGVKVILTTHSPSTIALSPEESIYVMGFTNPRLRKTSKDQALTVLTSGVPALSVNYENRRQVFVESKHDQFFYETINKKISLLYPTEISLDFLCAKKDGSSGCDEVKEIVGKLRSFGNSQIFGIIDWDGHNQSNEKIVVLGQNKRYSIENYILDPLVLSVYLVRERFVDKKKLGFTHLETYIEVRDFNEDRLQKIIDAFFLLITEITPDDADQKIAYCPLTNGITVKIPEWYLMMRGHDLERKLSQNFPQLNRFQKEAELKKDILYKIHEDLPGIFSKDLLDSLDYIRTN